MELRYPLLAIFLIICIIFYNIYFLKKDGKYSSGTRIANTHFLKNTDYYKHKIKEYNFLKKIIWITFSIAIFSSIVLFSRLASIETIHENKYSRDIFLCMDVSTSVDELNIELIENLKGTIKKLKGERIGISIFNTSSVTLVPLTEDYDYIIHTLNTIKKSMKANDIVKYGMYDEKDYFYIRNYIMSGTLEDNTIRGSSLIGDGLTSCVYHFPKQNDNRTKIIIFSTDNDLAGTPLIRLKDASNISKKEKVKVFGIGTKVMKEEDKIELKDAVENTGGKFYQHSTQTVNSIIKDIETTSKSLLKKQVETKKVDIPQIPFLLLIISITVFIFMNKKVI